MAHTFTWRRGLSFGRKLPMVFPYTSQVEKWIRRLLFSEQYLTWRHQQEENQHQIDFRGQFQKYRPISKRKWNWKGNSYHWQRIDEIAVNCVKRPRIVVSRSTDRRQINRLHIIKIRTNEHPKRHQWTTNHNAAIKINLKNTKIIKWSIKLKRKTMRIPDPPSWWGLQGENHAWYWYGGTEYAQPKED